MTKYAGWRDTDLATQLKQSIKIAKANKYNATRVQVDGIWFDSKAEAKRYNELKLMEKAAQIKELKVHPRYPIKYQDQPICDVELDFVYFDGSSCWLGNDHIYYGHWRYEDVKGRDNALSKLKRKLVEAFYGIKVEVIK